MGKKVYVSPENQTKTKKKTKTGQTTSLESRIVVLFSARGGGEQKIQTKTKKLIFVSLFQKSPRLQSLQELLQSPLLLLVCAIVRCIETVWFDGGIVSLDLEGTSCLPPRAGTPVYHKVPTECQHLFMKRKEMQFILLWKVLVY